MQAPKFYTIHVVKCIGYLYRHLDTVDESMIFLNSFSDIFRYLLLNMQISNYGVQNTQCRWIQYTSKFLCLGFVSPRRLQWVNVYVCTMVCVCVCVYVCVCVCEWERERERERERETHTHTHTHVHGCGICVFIHSHSRKETRYTSWPGDC